MVRGPAAVLTAVYGATLAFFILAPTLPAPAGLDALILASALPAVALLAGCALALLPLRDGLVPLICLAAGGAMLGAALTEAGLDAPANVFKALFAGAAGMTAARLLATPAVAIAVPVFVGVIDAVSVLGANSPVLLRGDEPASDLFVFALPAFGGGTVGLVPLSEVLFCAFFAACAWRFGLRRRPTAIALIAAPCVALIVAVAAGRAMPALPFLAAAMLLPSADLLPALIRSERAEEGSR